MHSKNAGFSFEQKRFWKRSLSKNDDVTIGMWFLSLTEFSFKHKPEITVDCRVFKFFQRSVDEKHLMRFKSAVLKFLCGSVNEASERRLYLAPFNI